jgi:co-chaperonin GroES (HSP10)
MKNTYTVTIPTVLTLPDAPFEPLGIKILALEVDADDRTSSGLIIIPDKHKRPTHKARVIAVGKRVREDIRPGDIILFEPYAETRIEKELKSTSEYILVPEDKVQAVERPEV